MIKLSSIKPNPNNPRLIKDDKFKKLVKSISEFPKMMELRPIVVDENNIILGGNMRYKALQELGKKEIPKEWIKKASDLSDDEVRRFIIADNVGFGEWDEEMLRVDWDVDELDEWGIDSETYDLDEFDTEFELPDGDKEPFQQMTFTLADEQAERIKEAMTEARGKEEYKYIETFANENSNGNALYFIISEWFQQRT